MNNLQSTVAIITTLLVAGSAAGKTPPPTEANPPKIDFPEDIEARNARIDRLISSTKNAVEELASADPRIIGLQGKNHWLVPGVDSEGADEATVLRVYPDINSGLDAEISLGKIGGKEMFDLMSGDDGHLACYSPDKIQRKTRKMVKGIKQKDWLCRTSPHIIDLDEERSFREGPVSYLAMQEVRAKQIMDLSSRIRLAVDRIELDRIRRDRDLYLDLDLDPTRCK